MTDLREIRAGLIAEPTVKQPWYKKSGLDCWADITGADIPRGMNSTEVRDWFKAGRPRGAARPAVPEAAAPAPSAVAQNAAMATPSEPTLSALGVAAFDPAQTASAEKKKVATSAVPKSKGHPLLWFFAAIVGLSIWGSLSDERNTPDGRRQGLHCLSPWDGTNASLVDAVKETLRSPASFERIETLVSPVNNEGLHRVVMKYRAQNGFGGMSVERAEALISHDTCKVVIRLR